LAGRLSEFVNGKTAHSSPVPLKAFFDQLRQEFDLTVVTLNYDDLIDRAGDWYDGFEPPTPGAGFGSFDFANFPCQVMTHPAVLLHLHGSVRFGYHGAGTGQIVRYVSPFYALETILYPKPGIAGPAPIVAGEDKDRWMTRACVPFGYYYSAFINSVYNCPRLLLAGYSASDLHVNSWLEDHHRVHECAKRMVLINNAKDVQTQHIPRALVFGGSDGNFPPHDPKQVREIIDGLRSAPSRHGATAI
jgi:hypothetical protein